MKIVYSEGALKDIELAEDYYYRISPDLANRFLEMLVATEHEIKSVVHFQIRYDDVRCRKMHVFPFMYHYVLDENEQIIVYGIIHTSKNPDEYWLYDSE